MESISSLQAVMPPSGLGSNLAVIELDREHGDVGAGFAAEFVTVGRDLAGGLDDNSVLNG